MTYFIFARSHERVSPFVKSDPSVAHVQATVNMPDVLISAFIDQEPSVFVMNHSTLVAHLVNCCRGGRKELTATIDTIYQAQCDTDVIVLDPCSIYHFPTQICCSNGETLLVLINDPKGASLVSDEILGTPSTSISHTDSDEYDVRCEAVMNLKPIIKNDKEQRQILKKNVKFLVTQFRKGSDCVVQTKCTTDDVLPTEGGYSDGVRQSKRRKNRLLARHYRYFRERMEKMQRMCLQAEDKTTAPSLANFGVGSQTMAAWREWKCPSRWRGIKKVVAGDMFFSILTVTGDILSVGCNRNGKLGLDSGVVSCSEPRCVLLAPPSNNSTLNTYEVDITAGKDHVLARLSTISCDRKYIDEVQGWGCNRNGRLGNGNNIQNVIKPKLIEVRTEAKHGPTRNDEAASCKVVSSLWTTICCTRRTPPNSPEAFELDTISQILAQGEWSLFLMETGELFIAGLGIESTSSQAVYPCIQVSVPPVRSLLEVLGHDYCLVVEMQDRSINLLTFGLVNKTNIYSAKVTPQSRILLRGADRSRNGTLTKCSIICIHSDPQDNSRYLHNIENRDILAILI